MDRFDFTQEQREFLNKAVSLGVVDAVSRMCMSTEHGADFKALSDDLLMVAHLGRHCPDGQERHSALCQALENCPLKTA